MSVRQLEARSAQELVMNKTRQPARRQSRAVAPTPAPTARLVQPAVLDEKQLKQVSGGNTDPQALPKGTW
jgi:bacteriocin-like protein